VYAPEVRRVRRIGVDLCKQRHGLRFNLPRIRELTPSRQKNACLTQSVDGRASTFAIHNLGLNEKTHRVKVLNFICPAIVAYGE
jgi:hypothetical protein